MVTKRSFWNDMNRHPQTDYRCVNNTYIVECSRSTNQLPSINHFTIWRHQDDGTADPELGEEDHEHDWVNVASAVGDRDDIDQLYSDLTSETAILEFRESEENLNWKRIPGREGQVTE